MKEQPLVSIIIPTYNRAFILGQTLESVQQQTYKKWECLIVDDDSSDYSSELVEFYCEKDSRFTYLKRPADLQKGANSCRNFGFLKSKGIYIQWLDSDDLLDIGKIEQQVQLMESGKLVDVTFCSWKSFHTNTLEKIQIIENENYEILKTPKELFDTMGENGDFFPNHAYLTKREVIYKAGLWNESLSINQDGEFFSRVLLAAKQISFCGNTEVYYRRGALEDHTSDYNTVTKARDSISCFLLIQESHRIRYKQEDLPYVDRAKKLLFYYLFKAGYMNVVLEHPDVFKEEIKVWKEEENKKRSLKRKFNRLKRFIEVKILKLG